MRVCIIWHSYGPYHNARLRASQALFADRGSQVVGVEIARQSGLHRWHRDPAHRGLVTLFPDRSIESISRRRVYAAVRAALEHLDPTAVAVPAYSNADAHAALAWARNKTRVAVVMSESTRGDAPRTELKERAKRAIVSGFDSALVGGSPQSRYLADLGMPLRQIFTPYDCVDNEYFARQAALARSQSYKTTELPGLNGSNVPFFLASGRFIERKNYEALVRAYAVYRASPGNAEPWNLIILGDGPSRAAVARIAEHVAPTGAVTLAGYRQVSEAAVYYGLAHAFVHPATIEQWGLVVNEAMAAGLPLLVSSNVGAAEDLVADQGNGFLFDPHDDGSITGALRRMADPATDRKAMGAKSAEIIKRWSPEQFAIGLWNAVERGAANQSVKRLATPARFLIWANLFAPRSLLSWRSAQP